MTIDTTVLDAMLKVVTDGPLMDTVVTHSKVIDIFEQNSNVLEGPAGRYVEQAVLLGYNESVGARGEHGAIPIPGSPTVINGRTKLKKIFASAQMTRNIMATAVKGKAAFAGWAEVELVKTERGLRSELDRMCIGFGAGAICRIDGSPTTSGNTSTIPIDAPYGLPGNEKGWLPGLRRGMRVVFGPNIDGTGLRSGGKSVLILSVNKAANAGGGQLSAQGLIPDLADNDFVFRGDDFGSNVMENGVEVETQGLLGMNDDGGIVKVYQNIDRSNIDEWKALVIDGSAAPYAGNTTEGLIQRVGMDAGELNDAETSHVLTTFAIWRNLYNQLKTTQGGFGSNESKSGNLTVGAKGISAWIGDRLVEVRAVPKFPVGKIMGLDASVLRRFHLSDFQWDDTTGSIFKQVQNGQYVKDEFWAYGRTELEFGCWNPMKLWRIDNLSESAI
jgi:hypothetical protein